MTNLSSRTPGGVKIAVLSTLFLLAQGCGDSASSPGAPDATPDIEAPTATISPTSGASEIDRHVPIAVTFSEEMLASTIDSESLTLTGPQGAVTGVVALDAATHVATFTPATALDMRASYTATLASTITDLAGNSLVELSSAFTIRDGRWQGAELAEVYDGGFGATKAQVAFDSQGNALAVWIQDDGVQGNVWSNRYSPTSGWGAALLIETNDDESATNLKLAVNASGDALALWQHGPDIWSNRYLSGSGWGTAVAIDSAAGGAADPAIAIDPSGNGFALWRQNAIGRNDVWFNRYLASEGWGTASLLETDDAGSAAGPSIATDPAGNAIAVWRQSDGNVVNMVARVFSVDGGWAAPTLIETDDTGGAIENQIAIAANGDALVVWRQSDGTRNNIWANRHTDSGWESATLIESNDTGDAAAPQVAIDSAGEAFAVWYQFDGTRNNIWSSRYSVTSGWGTPKILEDENLGNAVFPQIAVDAHGYAIAVWHQFDGTRDNVWSSRYTPDLGWGDASLLEVENAGGAIRPHIAMDASGNALALWSHYNGIRENIMSSRFD